MAHRSTTHRSTTHDRRWGMALGVLYILLSVALGYMLFKIWPPVPWPDPNVHPDAVARALADCGVLLPTPSPVPSGSPAGDRQRLAPTVMPINFFFKKCVMTSFDERLILLVIVAGMLGSFVHGATSLADYIGNDRLNSKWKWFYILRPAIGMALALIFYFVIRGGFLTTNVGATDINPYGVAALAGLVGMFSKQATDKLSEVFTTLFRSGSGEGDEKREDPLKPTPSLTITSIDPLEVTARGGRLKITVTGTGFVEGSTVFLNDSPQVTAFESATSLRADVAAETIAEPGVLKLTVVKPDQTKSAPIEFKVVTAIPAQLKIESIEPPHVPALSTSQKIEIKGTGFVAGCNVTLNGITQETTFESADKLSAQLADASIATRGPLKLKVINPDGSQSGEIDFTVS